MRGIYVHVPFCARACPYCDFDFTVGRSPEVERWFAGLAAEVAARGDELAEWACSEDHGQADRWSTVYVGGGTPSLLGRQGIERLAGWIGRRFPGAGQLEWTVEVNPEHGTRELYAAIRAGGGTRVSLGTQSLHPGGLKLLGRAHAPREGLEAIAAAVGEGLRVSADLIVGWPGQTAAQVETDVRGLVEAGAGHVSVYALTIEEGTPWLKLVRRGKRALPEAGHQADMLAASEAALTGAGLSHYEVASYARPGEESRHNLLYWTWQDYVGLGPSAHSARYLPSGSVIRRGNRRGLEAWLAAPGEPGEREVLEPEAAAAEGLWTGLRYLRGVDVPAFLGRFPAVSRAWVEARVRRQIARGNLRFSADGSVLQIASGRWLWHDTISADLL